MKLLAGRKHSEKQLSVAKLLNEGMSVTERRRERYKQVREPVVGEKVYFYDTYCKGMVESTINKVGRKYFYIGYFDRKINKNTLVEEKDWGDCVRVFLSKQEYLDDQEKQRLYMKIRETFYKWGSEDKVTLEQLRKIAEILNIESTVNE